MTLKAQEVTFVQTGFIWDISYVEKINEIIAIIIIGQNPYDKIIINDSKMLRSVRKYDFVAITYVGVVIDGDFKFYPKAMTVLGHSEYFNLKQP